MAFNKYLGSIQAKIGGRALIAQYQEGRIRVIEGKDDLAANKEHQSSWTRRGRRWNSSTPTVTFPPRRAPCHLLSSHQRRRRQQRQRGLYRGLDRHRDRHFQLPPKLLTSTLKVASSNATDFGTRISAGEFARMIYSNPRNGHSFTYPGDRLLMLQGHHSGRGDAPPDCTLTRTTTRALW